MNTINVAVLMGGPSSEHDISLKSGQAIVDALRNCGFNVYDIKFDQPVLPGLPPHTDVVFPALHGRFGEDGEIQEQLEKRGIAYVGSDASASRLMINKHLTKQRLKEYGLPVLPGILIHSTDHPIPTELELPLIAKPNNGGSTIGIKIITTPNEWRESLEAVFKHDTEVLVEALLAKPIEVTVGLVDGKALPVVEIVYAGDIFDYDAKYVYSKGATQYFCPPQTISLTIQNNLQRLAESAYIALGARDLLRIDILIDKATNAPWILEANSLPGFTASSLLPKAAAVAGYKFTELCQHLIECARSRIR